MSQFYFDTWVNMVGINALHVAQATEAAARRKSETATGEKRAFTVL